jgi:2-polyprenyl-3-methyl-5-hydroxy-6-metoxy-1,4-benzoquinol methylase
MDLLVRSTLDEVMDGPGVSAADYARCLRDLAAVNRVTMTHAPTLRWLTRMTSELPRGAGVSILDIGYGDGDLLRTVRGWAERRGLSATLEGIDRNPRSAVIAADATPPGSPIIYRTADVFEYTPQPPPDMIVCSHFTHHLNDADVLRFLAWVDRHALRGWFIADLQRHIVPYLGFRVLATLARWHPIVRSDGTISIARSFRRADWLGYLAQTGLTAEIAWRFPFRLCVGRQK